MRICALGDLMLDVVVRTSGSSVSGFALDRLLVAGGVFERGEARRVGGERV